VGVELIHVTAVHCSADLLALINQRWRNFKYSTVKCDFRVTRWAECEPSVTHKWTSDDSFTTQVGFLFAILCCADSVLPIDCHLFWMLAVTSGDVPPTVFSRNRSHWLSLILSQSCPVAAPDRIPTIHPIFRLTLSAIFIGSQPGNIIVLSSLREMGCSLFSLNLDFSWQLVTQPKMLLRSVNRQVLNASLSCHYHHWNPSDRPLLRSLWERVSKTLFNWPRLKGHRSCDSTITGKTVDDHTKVQ
jgi:hypothetical protein